MYLTDNPMSDLTKLFGLMTGKESEQTTGASTFNMPAALDAATVMQLLISECLITATSIVMLT